MGMGTGMSTKVGTWVVVNKKDRRSLTSTGTGSSRKSQAEDLDCDDGRSKA